MNENDVLSTSDKTINQIRILKYDITNFPVMKMLTL